MFSFTNIAPQDLNGVYALLAAIADPKGFKASMEDLSKQIEIYKATLTEANAAIAQAKADKEAADAVLKQANDLLAKNQKDAADLVSRAAQMKQMSDAIDRRESDVTTTENAAKEAFAVRELAVSANETRAHNLLNQAMADASAAAKTRSDYETRLNKLKALAG